MTHRLLDALSGKNRGRPPVWFMRQAGRYLPEYRKLRERYALRELFLTPELAAEVTLMPLRRYPLDAAILFSDITAVALALGLDLDFAEGPLVTPQVTPQTPLAFAPERLEPILQAVRLLKPGLDVPLLGFAGAPFTVATYLAKDALGWLRSDPATFHQFLQKIEAVTQRYLQMQRDAGADAIQLFDSWANRLTREEFLEFSLPYVRRLLQARISHKNSSKGDATDCADLPRDCEKCGQGPSIFFMRGSTRYLNELAHLPAALSLDWEIPLSQARQTTLQPLQGNLNPDLLFESLPTIRREAQTLLHAMQGDPAFILNLGHGVKPGTPVEAIQTLVETVQGFPGEYTQTI